MAKETYTWQDVDGIASAEVEKHSIKVVGHDGQQNRRKQMSLLTGPFQPYNFTGEIEFLKKLGLNHQYYAKWGEDTYLGEYKNNQSTIKVYVICMPAKFWKFEIETPDGQKWELTTGSGTIADYWPIALKFSEGMISAKRIQKTAEE